MINDGENVKQQPNRYKIRETLINGSTKEAMSASSNGNVVKSIADSDKTDSGLIAAAAHAVVPTWANIVLMGSLIFGGCCANVSQSTIGLFT